MADAIKIVLDLAQGSTADSKEAPETHEEHTQAIEMVERLLDRLDDVQAASERLKAAMKRIATAHHGRCQRAQKYGRNTVMLFAQRFFGKRV